MARRREESDANVLGRAFWDVDSAARPMPDTQEAWAAFETQQLRYAILSAVQKRLAECGMTQQQLAARMGVSEGRISQVLSGDQNLTIKTLAAIAAALGARFSVTLTDRSLESVPERV